MLKFILLGPLDYGPMSGYELEGWINASTGNLWHANLSQIYTTLKPGQKLREPKVLFVKLEPEIVDKERAARGARDRGMRDECGAYRVGNDSQSRRDLAFRQPDVLTSGCSRLAANSSPPSLTWLPAS